MFENYGLKVAQLCMHTKVCNALIRRSLYIDDWTWLKMSNFRFDDSCVTNTGLNNVMMQQPYMLYYIRSSPTIVPRPLVAKVPSSPIQKTKTFDSGHRKPEMKEARPEIKFKNSFVAKEKLVTSNRFDPMASPAKEMKNRFIGPERPKSSNEFKIKQKNGFLNAEQKDKQKHSRFCYNYAVNLRLTVVLIQWFIWPKII